jgi:hypothetical protein
MDAAPPYPTIGGGGKRGWRPIWSVVILEEQNIETYRERA